jgi:hypothetical protein
MSRIVGGVVAVLVLVAATGAVERSVALPAPEELVPNTVALVSEVPVRRGTITKAEFRHALVLVTAFKDRGSVPKSGERGYERLEREAVDNLLEAIWIQGLAAEMGIAVTRRQVSLELARVKEESFKSLAEFREFLREAHYTKRDLNERVELQVLSQRLQERLQRKIEREARNPFEEKQALNEFVAEFNERWRSRTVCAPQYATDRCSNGPPPPDRARRRPAGQAKVDSGASLRLPAF